MAAPTALLSVGMVLLTTIFYLHWLSKLATYDHVTGEDIAFRYLTCIVAGALVIFAPAPPMLKLGLGLTLACIFHKRWPESISALAMVFISFVQVSEGESDYLLAVSMQGLLVALNPFGFVLPWWRDRICSKSKHPIPFGLTPYCATAVSWCLTLLARFLGSPDNIIVVIAGCLLWMGVALIRVAGSPVCCCHRSAILWTDDAIAFMVIWSSSFNIVNTLDVAEKSSALVRMGAHAFLFAVIFLFAHKSTRMTCNAIRIIVSLLLLVVLLSQPHVHDDANNGAAATTTATPNRAILTGAVLTVVVSMLQPLVREWLDPKESNSETETSAGAGQITSGMPV